MISNCTKLNTSLTRLVLAVCCTIDLLVLRCQCLGDQNGGSRKWRIGRWVGLARCASQQLAARSSSIDPLSACICSGFTCAALGGLASAADGCCSGSERGW
eukprot:4631989-Amphidinium_carterae.1